MQHLPRGYVRLKNSVLASAEGLFRMDADRFALERAARALVEESEGHVNAYKVWNVSHSFSNRVMLVRCLFAGGMTA